MWPSGSQFLGSQRPSGQMPNWCADEIQLYHSPQVACLTPPFDKSLAESRQLPYEHTRKLTAREDCFSSGPPFRAHLNCLANDGESQGEEVQIYVRVLLRPKNNARSR